MHTYYSDGVLSPAALVQEAAGRQLAAIAVTDHDTTDGTAEAMAEGVRLGLEVIPGVEFSTVAESCDIHILGLFIRPESEVLKSALALQLKAREARNRESVEKIRKAGFYISDRELAAAETGGILTRGRIGSILTARGYAPDSRTAVRSFLSYGSLGYVQLKVPEPAQAVEVIHRAGGLALVAHLNQIDKYDRGHSLALCRRVLAEGADGLETLHASFDAGWLEAAEQIARETGCLRSGGSDFHQYQKNGSEPGIGRGNLRIPYEFVESMREKLK